MAASQVVVHEEGETLRPSMTVHQSIGRTLSCVCLGKVCGVFSNSLECIRLSLVLLMVGAGQTGCHGNSLICWESIACILHYKEDTLNEKNR